jgi:hypothetical protein
LQSAVAPVAPVIAASSSIIAVAIGKLAGSRGETPESSTLSDFPLRQTEDAA